MLVTQAVCVCLSVCVCNGSGVLRLISPNLSGSHVSVSVASVYGRHAGCGITGIDPLPLRLTEASTLVLRFTKNLRG